MENVRAGQSRVLVLRGEAGVGKTALLDYLLERASGCRIARAAGVESEMELPFAGLHQLCAPMLERLDRLPGPQGDALGAAFGLRAGDAPDRFLVGLAALTLLSEVAEERPLVCIVDDAQWLDHASAQVLDFVARRLLAESIALVCAVRESERRRPDGLPELPIRGLGDRDARALCSTTCHGPLDERVRDRIVGRDPRQPLALLELPRTWNMAAELAGGFGLPGARRWPARSSRASGGGWACSPPTTQRLLLVAAAPSRSATRCRCGVRPSGSGSGSRPRPRRTRPAWSSSAAGCGSVIRWSARRSTGRPRRRRAIGCIGPRRGDRSRPRSRPARLAPRPSRRELDEDVAAELERSAGAPRPAAASPRRPPSSSAPPSSRPSRRAGLGARWPPRRASTRPARPTRRWTCWPWPRPDRSTSSSEPVRSCFAPRSRSP